MPKRPRGKQSPADVIGAAVNVMRIATGEEGDTPPPDHGKDVAAVSMGWEGGAARAAAMTPERRAEVARAAAAKRWEALVWPAKLYDLGRSRLRGSGFYLGF